MEDRLNNQAGMVSPLGENGVIFNARGYFLTALGKKNKRPRNPLFIFCYPCYTPSPTFGMTLH